MQVFDWLDRLIAFDTVSCHSNLKLIDMLQDWCKKRSLITRLTRAPTEEKANLVASLPDKNGNIAGGLVLSGHTDTVPVDGQDWQSNPFEAKRLNDKIYGRGACDMKGFLAACLAMVPEWQAQPLPYPIHLAFSYDEEVGLRGAPLLIDDMLKAGLAPKACIVGEPTMMRVVVAHKGIQSYRCRVKGIAAHSSLTLQGSNAIEYAARFIAYIRSVADRIRVEGPFDTYFDVPYTTISTNLIQGGLAANIVPEACEFTFEFRNLPNVKPQTVLQIIEGYMREELLPAMRLEHEKVGVTLDNTAVAPSFESATGDTFIAQARKLLGDEEIHKVAYATEAGLFQNAGIPTIVCGPGSIEQAHKANEYVDVAQLEKCCEFLRKVVLMGV